VDDTVALDDMFDWLRHDLSHTAQRWKIVAMHHSPYSTGQHHTDIEVPIIQSKLVPIMQQYGVDLVLTGHDHLYQRTKPLRDGAITTIDEGGIVYIVTGAGAAASYSCTSAVWLETSICAKDYGVYSRIKVSGDTMTLEAVDDFGRIKDSFTFPVASLPTSTPTPPFPTVTPTSPNIEPRPQLWLPVILRN
jgi:3',5'-cyclic AMP phosphodiesterase CpdA